MRHDEPKNLDAAANDDDGDEADEYEQRIRRTGCYEHHEALQECYWRTKDWRQCQQEMQRFRECFQQQQRQQRQSISTAQGGNSSAKPVV